MEHEEIDYSVCMPVVRHDHPGGRGLLQERGAGKTCRRLLGFQLGDGRLNYVPEQIIEGYYALGIFREPSNISIDVQQIWNPGYNHDRGPVTIFGLRLNLAI